MFNSINLLSILSNRIHYDRFINVIIIDNLDRYSKKIIEEIGEYFLVTKDTDKIIWSDFQEYFYTSNQNIVGSNKDIFNKIFKRVAESKEDSDIHKEIVKHFIERHYARQIANEALLVSDGNKKGAIENIDTLLRECDNETGRISTFEDWLVTDDIKILLEDTIGATGFNWILRELNLSLGPLRMGDSVCIAAYVDSGKSTLALSQLGGMATQLDTVYPDDPTKQLLIFANEEKGKQSKLRLIQSIIGFTNQQMRDSSWETINKAYTELIDPNRIKFYYNTDMTLSSVESILRQCNPGLILFDQLYNIKGLNIKNATHTDSHTELAKWVRKISGTVAPCISIHQADGTAIGCKYIQMNQLYYSKVGMQGAFDAIITVGRENNLPPGREDERGVFIPKNKLSGGPNSNPKLKNAKWEVKINSDIVRFDSPKERGK